MTDDKNDETDVHRRTVLSNVDETKRHGETVTDTRRGVLQRAVGVAGAAVVSSLGFSGAASALSGTPEEHAVASVRQYDSKSTVTKTLASGTTELRKTLSRSGYLDTASAAEFTDLERLAVGEYLKAEEGIAVVGTVHDGTPTTKIEVSKQVPDHELKVVLFPNSVNLRRRSVPAGIPPVHSRSKQVLPR
ncbi:hypothetical protein SAMN05421858_0714 [Haladaptatus litoreus]|uniref:Uncharacterized protein n=1 Tax=Haladaptatus litoreus TaxID=553468 RepID=A0A1N6WGL1_9EURY|nr:hypothetical protein [Haladaptatus litoreus]SIQ89214.1 hypothetical protein SAMN05421858_0714 [Haladaptatus litoreus]